MAELVARRVSARANKAIVTNPDRVTKRCARCKMPSGGAELCDVCTAERVSTSHRAAVGVRGDGRPRLQQLSPDLQLQILHKLSPSSAAALTMTCAEFWDLMRQNERRYWLLHLRQRHIKVAMDEDAPVNLRSLYNLCFTPDDCPRLLEAQGMSVQQPNVGEERSWWKATPVGFQVSMRPEPAVAVTVRFQGYQPDDVEVRSLDKLRRLQGSSELLEWRRAPRAVDEPVEVSWAVHGHPTAKWEAVIMEVGSRPGRVDHDGQVRVRYTGFERSWDEWIGVRSTRINPRRSHAALRLCDFVAHPTSHTK